MSRLKNFDFNNKLKYMRLASFFGHSAFYLVLLLLLFFSNSKDAFGSLAAAFVYSFLAAYIIRVFYKKYRPDHEKGKRSFFQEIDARTFPSLHSARAAIYLYFAIHYGAGAVLLLLSVAGFFLIPYSRIFLKRHFPEDAVAGLLLGLVAGYLATVTGF